MESLVEEEGGGKEGGREGIQEIVVAEKQCFPWQFLGGSVARYICQSSKTTFSPELTTAGYR